MFSTSVLSVLQKTGKWWNIRWVIPARWFIADSPPEEQGSDRNSHIHNICSMTKADSAEWVRKAEMRPTVGVASTSGNGLDVVDGLYLQSVMWSNLTLRTLCPLTGTLNNVLRFGFWDGRRRLALKYILYTVLQFVAFGGSSGVSDVESDSELWLM